jgi:hypothetical protein
MLLRSNQAVLLSCLLNVVGHLGVHASEMCVRVDDYADLPLPNAWVNVTDLRNTGVDSTTVRTFNKSTDSRGKACLAVPEGTYSVEAGLTGFLNVRYYPVRVVYPNPVELSFRLPVGDVIEGGVSPEALLSGTLQLDGSAIEGAKICVLQQSGPGVVVCGLTNVFGEYALSVPPGVYRTELRTPRGQIYRSTVDVRHPGHYRDRVTTGGQEIPRPTVKPDL